MPGRGAKRWSIRDGERGTEEKLRGALGLRPLTARLLGNRGIVSPEEGAHFLHPKLGDLHDPFLLKDMAPAVMRIRKALLEREKILILGDYDVDGVTATALLLRLFRLLHADTGFHIPHRLEEGYGLHAESMEGFAEEGAKLLVSVDSGVTAREPVARARTLGMDVIVTDHHEPAGALPECTAVIDPKRADETYPFRDLSGVGVAFKLAWALAREVSPGKEVPEDVKSFLWECLGLVALGTVADVVPLKGENRILVRHGLKSLGASRHPGERALLSSVGAENPDASELAFRLGPRINAAGRLGDSRLAVDILTNHSFENAVKEVRNLDRMNRKRQKIERRIFEEANEKVRARKADAHPAIVLEDEDWHAGVIGIVASKLVEAYGRPVVLIALDGDRGRGSARSIPSFHIHEAMKQCASTLDSFGGHAQAAGLSVPRDRLESFRDRFCQVAAEQLAVDDLAPRLEVEAEISLRDLDNSFLAEMALFHPFGKENPEPVLAVRDGVIAGVPKRVGSEGQHLSFHFRDGPVALRAIAFHFGELATVLEGARADLAFVPFINRFRGRETLELKVKDVRALGPA
ncbi:MAG: single-stranded-DNA-specific exonuclease RecJ [Planctomycetota bacterium]|jgi:single-stranded-DNA-specific exonuclease